MGTYKLAPDHREHLAQGHSQREHPLLGQSGVEAAFLATHRSDVRCHTTEPCRQLCTYALVPWWRVVLAIVSLVVTVDRNTSHPSTARMSTSRTIRTRSSIFCRGAVCERASYTASARASISCAVQTARNTSRKATASANIPCSARARAFTSRTAVSHVTASRTDAARIHLQKRTTTAARKTSSTDTALATTPCATTACDRRPRGYRCREWHSHDDGQRNQLLLGYGVRDHLSHDHRRT